LLGICFWAPSAPPRGVVADAVVVLGLLWDTTLSESSLITSSAPELPVVAAQALAFALSSLPPLNPLEVATENERWRP